MRLLAVCLFLCLTAAGCANRTGTGIKVDPVLEKVISPDTKALGGIQFAKLKVTLFYQRHLAQLDIPLLTAMSQQTGFDPRRDLTELLVSWNGKQMLLTGSGRFAEDQITRRLSAASAPRKYKAYTLFGTESGVVTFPASQLLIAGPPHAVEAALDLHASGDAEVPEELRGGLASLPETDQIWAVSRGGLPFADAPMRSDYASILSNLVGYVSDTNAGLTVATGIRFQAQITCVSEAGAKRVYDALRGGIGLARLTTKENQPDLLRLYDSIHVSQDRQIVHIDSDLPEQLAGTLLDQLIRLPGSGSARQ